MRAPSPYFGGKRAAAPLIWDALGDAGGPREAHTRPGEDRMGRGRLRRSRRIVAHPGTPATYQHHALRSITMNDLLRRLPANARRHIYTTFLAITIAIGATAAAYVAVGSAIPSWVTAATAVATYLGIPVAAASRANTPDTDTDTDSAQ